MTDASKISPVEYLKQPPGPVKTYHGSCHCGNLKYDVDLPEDLKNANHGKCNCTICTKSNLHTITPPDIKTFKLTGPKDQSTFGDYTFGSGNIHHEFCKICGIRLYCRGNIPEMGGECLFLNMYTLDDVDLSVMKSARYADGRSESWKVQGTPIPPGGW